MGAAGEQEEEKAAAEVPLGEEGRRLKSTLTAMNSEPQLADFISLFRVYLQTFVFSVICCVCAFACVLVLAERLQSLLCLVRARLGSLLERKTPDSTHFYAQTYSDRLDSLDQNLNAQKLRGLRACKTEHVQRLCSQQNACNAPRAARPLYRTHIKQALMYNYWEF